MSAIFVAMLVVYLNGDPVDVELIGASTTMEKCQHALPGVIESARQSVTKEYQLEAKCLNYGDATGQVSAFGTATKL
jgi:hypothetical protein